MRIDCYECNAVYEIPSEAIGPGGARAQCPRCGAQQTVRPDRTEVRRMLGVEQAPEPSAADRDALFDFSQTAGPSPAEDPLDPFGLPPAAPAPVATGAAEVPADDDPFASLGLPPPSAAPVAPGSGQAPAEADPFESLGMPSAPGDPVTATSDEDDLFASLAKPGRGRPSDVATSSPPATAPAPTGEASTPPLPTGVDSIEPFGEAAGGPSAPVAIGAHAPSAAGTTFVYKIKKLDGRILGPFNIDVIEEMAEAGDVAPGDQIARGKDEFRLLSQYPESRALIEKAASRYRVKSVREPYQNQSRKRWPLFVSGGMALLLALFAGTLVLAPETLPDNLRSLFDPLLERSRPRIDNPVRDELSLYRLQVQELDREAAAYLIQADAFMAEDTSSAYSKADLAIKSALILDPDNPSAIGRFVLNAALVHQWRPNPSTLQTLLSYARYLEEAAPEDPLSLFARAAVLVMVGADGFEARSLASRGLEASPGEGTGRLVLARATALIDHRAAIDILEDLAGDESAPRRVHMELAHVCTEAGDIVCARRALERRLELDPEHEEATDALGELLVMVGRHQEASELHLEVLAGRPERIDSALALAMIDYQIGGNLSAAQRRIDSLLGARGESRGGEIDRRLRVHAATLARLTGARDRAKALLAEVFEEVPHHGPASHLSVLIALDEGDLETASARLPAALVDMDHPAKAAVLRGLVQITRENFEEAGREARRAGVAQPEAIEPILLAAAIEGRRGQPQQAYIQLRRALSLDPLEVRQRRSLTDYWDGTGIEAAIAAGFEALVARDPEQGMAHAGLGIARWMSGDLRGARASLGQAVRLDRQNLPALVYLGVLDLQAGNVRGASSWIERAVGADGNHPLPRYLLGRVSERRGAAQAASSAYRDALRRDQAFHPAQIRQAVLLAAEDPEQSAAALRRIVLSRPENPAAREALFEIGR